MTKEEPRGELERASSIDKKAPADFAGVAVVHSLPIQPAAVYLPILHSDSPLTPAPADSDDRGLPGAPEPSFLYTV
jgi:hypothetical protein